MVTNHRRRNFKPLAREAESDMSAEARMREAAMAALKKQKAAEPVKKANGGNYVPPHKRPAEDAADDAKVQKVN